MAAPDSRPTAQQRPLVLVVDDEPLMRRVLTLSLQEEYRVMAAADAHDALELFDVMGRDIAAVVTDIRLPEMDGPSLAWNLKRQGSPPPILFISGYAAPSEATGPFLAKPFTPDDLLVAVRRLVAGYVRVSPTT